MRPGHGIKTTLRRADETAVSGLRPNIVEKDRNTYRWLLPRYGKPRYCWVIQLDTR
jgi:hypothetical protein